MQHGPRNTPQHTTTNHKPNGGSTAVDTNSAGSGVDPIFVSVKQAAQMLAISPWSCYQLLDAGDIESRYQGRRRLVLVSSIRDYATGLPTERPDGAA